MSMTEKLLTIEEQILQLQEKKKKVEDKRKKDLISLLQRAGALTLPDSVIAGVLVDTLNNYPLEKKEIDRLNALGQAVLKPGRGRRKKTSLLNSQ